MGRIRRSAVAPILGLVAPVAAVVVALLVLPQDEAGERAGRGVTEETAAPQGPGPEIADRRSRPRAARPGAPTPLAAEGDPPGAPAVVVKRRKLRVLCVRSDTGAPIPDLRVAVSWPGKSPWGRTGPDGVWITPQPPGPAQVRAGEDADVNGCWFLDAEADVAAGTEEIRMEVQPTGVVSGVVEDADGAAADSVDVMAVAEGRTVARDRSDERGEFYLRIPEGTVVEVVARHFDGRFLEARSDPRSATAEDVRLRLAADPLDAEIEVLVLDPDGIPVADARVSMTLVVHRSGPIRIDGRAPFPAPPSAFTGPDGRARLRGLPRRPVAIRVAPPDAPGGAGISSGLDEVVAGGEPVTVSLLRGTLLVGRVVDTSGTGVARAVVKAHAEGGAADFGAASTDPAGGFRLEVEGRHTGTFRVSAQASRLRGEERGVAGGATDLRIVLADGD